MSTKVTNRAGYAVTMQHDLLITLHEYAIV
jgi:hypothetical protein